MKRLRIAPLLFVLSAVCIGMYAWSFFVKYRTDLASRYQSMRSRQEFGHKLVFVDKATFDKWKSRIDSKGWTAVRTTRDAFSASFAQLPRAGFEPSIEGYLALLSADLPPPEQLSIAQLKRWKHAAAMRMIVDGIEDGDIHVYKSGETIQGFRLPTSDAANEAHFALLENGSYAEYLCSPVQEQRQRKTPADETRTAGPEIPANN